MRHRPEALKKTNVKFNDSIEEHVFCNGDVEGRFRMAARVSGPSQGSRAPLSPVLPLGTTYLKLTPRNNQDNESTRQSLPSFETQNDRNEIGRAMHYSAHGSITLDLGGAGQARPLWPRPGERLKTPTGTPTTTGIFLGSENSIDNHARSRTGFSASSTDKVESLPYEHTLPTTHLVGPENRWARGSPTKLSEAYLTGSFVFV